MSAPMTLALFSVLIIAEGYVLYSGQRRLFWAVQHRTNSRLLAYLLAAPGTALHESAHYLVCLALGVPAGDQVTDSGGRRGRVSFFFPKEAEDGSITLGSVPHAHTDPLRQALVATAPIYLVPPLFVGISALMFGSDIISDPWDAFWAGAWWAKIAWVYVAFSCGQAAFPSPGDHIGFIGGGCLIALAGLIGLAIHSRGGTAGLAHAAGVVAAVLAAPAAAGGISLLALGGIPRRPAAPLNEWDDVQPD